MLILVGECLATETFVGGEKILLGGYFAAVLVAVNLSEGGLEPPILVARGFAFVCAGMLWRSCTRSIIAMVRTPDIASVTLPLCRPNKNSLPLQMRKS